MSGHDQLAAAHSELTVAKAILRLGGSRADFDKAEAAALAKIGRLEKEQANRRRGVR